MKKLKYGFVFVLITALLFTGCAAKSTNLVFSFNTSTPYDSQEEKTIYFNEAHDRITLDAKLEIDAGSVSLYVYDSNNEAIWSGTYDESENFRIELTNITADEEYKLEIQTDQTKKVELNISSWEKLVKSKDKPIP